MEAGFPDPRQSEAWAPSRFLQRRYKTYQNLDKNLKQQTMHARAQLPFSTPAEKATADLALGAFFFAMRSYEYVHVTGTQRTRPLRLENLRFFRNNRVMSLDNPDLCLATALSIPFEFQKTDVRNKTVHQHVTEHPILCPILRWAAIVQRILADVVQS
jgi:hypothetical protein